MLTNIKQLVRIGNKNRLILVCLLAILLLSLILRWALVFNGGQFFFPDEERYLQSRVIVQDLLQGNFPNAVYDAIRTPDHLGFKVVGVIPAIFEAVFPNGWPWPALFFSGFSVLNIFIIGLITIESGGTIEEAMIASILLSLSNSYFYYARHLLPYDVSMTFGLISIYLGVKRRDGFGLSLLSGIFAFIAFITYNGYWTLGLISGMIHIIYRRKDYQPRLVRGLEFILGVGLSILVLLSISIRYNLQLIPFYMTFLTTITQGSFSEGWSFAFNYLWDVEHFTFIIWFILLFWALYRMYSSFTPRIVLWIACLLMIYGLEVILSVYLHLFVVYGRLVREMVPFFCLIGAFSIHTLSKLRIPGKVLANAILGLIAIQAYFNFSQSFSIVYPLEFRQEAQIRFPDFKMPVELTRYTSPAIVQSGNYVTVNVKFIYPSPENVETPKGFLLLSENHPMKFRPYQYEGYNPYERAAFNDRDVKMMLFFDRPQ